MATPRSRTDSALRRLCAALGWNRSSYFLLSLLAATAVVVVIVWWPLVEEQLAYFDPGRPWWVQTDWLLLGTFAAMSLLIMAGADLRRDALVVLVGLGGGLVIESWGTQTELWVYYTRQRPPLWIIPAWPIASLAIDRLVRLLDRLAPRGAAYRWAYWPLLSGFYTLEVCFAWPTRGRSLTVMALALSLLLILTPTDHRKAVLTFIAGSALGYFLERWGTTRACWTYYTQQTPPLFAVLAHGFAALAFWRVGELARRLSRGTLRMRSLREAE
jgi:hypothetical protein